MASIRLSIDPAFAKGGGGAVMSDQGAGVDACSGLQDHPDERRAAEHGPVSATDAPRDFYRELEALRQQIIDRYSKRSP